MPPSADECCDAGGPWSRRTARVHAGISARTFQPGRGPRVASTIDSGPTREDKSPKEADMLDLLIRGDRVATVNGAGAWDIGIQGEKIAAVAAAGSIRDADAHRVIDARGKIVIPGGIDPHIHCKFGQPSGHLSFPPDVVSR